MYLINETHHLSERREYEFNILLEYPIITYLTQSPVPTSMICKWAENNFCIELVIGECILGSCAYHYNDLIQKNGYNNWIDKSRENFL